MKILVADVLRAVAEVDGVALDELVGSRRTVRLVRPRQRAMYLARQVCPHASFPMIARACGGRDHATAMYAVAKVRRRLAQCDQAEAAALHNAALRLGLAGMPADRGDGIADARLDRWGR